MLADHSVHPTIPTPDVPSLPRFCDGIADVGAGCAAWLKGPDGNLIGACRCKPDA